MRSALLLRTLYGVRVAHQHIDTQTGSSWAYTFRLHNPLCHDCPATPQPACLEPITNSNQNVTAHQVRPYLPLVSLGPLPCLSANTLPNTTHHTPVNVMTPPETQTQHSPGSRPTCHSYQIPCQHVSALKLRPKQHATHQSTSHGSHDQTQNPAAAAAAAAGSPSAAAVVAAA